MAKFDESNVVRSKAAGTGGQFAEKHQSPGANLPPAVSAAGITAAPGVPPQVAHGLAQAGLTGSLSPYQGDNPDYPDESLTYKHPESDYELDLYRNEKGGYTVSYEDRFDEGNNFTVTTEDSSEEKLAGTLKDTLFELDTTDAGHGAYSASGADQEEFELRETEVGVGPDGIARSSILVSDDEGDWIHVNHDHSTGDTSLSTDGEAIEGEAAEELLNRIMGGGEDARGRVAAMFDRTLAGAAASRFAPEAIRSSGSPEA